MLLSRIPIAPQWHSQNNCVCTPDGGFLYIGCKSINYIGRIKDESNAPVIKVFPTRQIILGVDVDPGWCHRTEIADDNEEVECDNYFAVLAQDNSIQIWDFDKGMAVRGHKAHLNMHVEGEHHGGKNKSKFFNHGRNDNVLFGYMSSRKVLSVDSRDLVVYCVASNSFYKRPMFVSTRNQIFTAIRCAPHNENIFALGTSTGLVVVCDLEKMCTIYTFRGHDAAISSLSWMSISRMPDKIEPTEISPVRNPDNEHVVTSDSSKQNTDINGADEIFDIYDFDYLENEFGAPTTISTENTSAFETETSMSVGFSAKFDFAEACKNLKYDIDVLKKDATDSTDSNAQEVSGQEENAVTLKDCQRAKPVDNISSSYGVDSSEGSLELVDYSSSSDHVDGNTPKTKILHKAEVHAVQTLEGIELLPECDVEKEKNDEKNTSQEKSMEYEEGSYVKIEDHKKQSLPSSAPNADILLASASIDGHFWIWNAGTGASCDHFQASGSAYGCKNAKQRKNTNIHIAWLSTSELLTTNKQGDLTLFRQKACNSEKEKSPEFISRYKYKRDTRKFMSRSVVAFSSIMKTGYIWCISSYREVICEDLEAERIIANYSCAPTNISVMRECPEDMNKIAFGFPDHRIGIIDISKISPTSVYIENFSLQITSQVLTIVWSKDCKRLAFGTLEGRVGILNVSKSQQQPHIFNPICGKPIYSIAWEGKYLYVVGNDSLAVYDETSNKKDGHLVPGIRNISVVSVREEFLFVGTQRGHVQLFRRSSETRHYYELLDDVEIAPRYITDIAWNSVATDRFAVSSKSNYIHIFTFNAAECSLVLLRKFEIHNVSAANTKIKWSNRSESVFLTCGFDGTLRVWDLTNEKNEPKFIKHFHCPMSCGLFLPSDEEIILCAGRTTSIEMIDMRTNESMLDNVPENSKQTIIDTLSNVQWAQKMKSVEKKTTNAEEKRRHKRALARKEANITAAENINAKYESEINNETAAESTTSNNMNIVEKFNNLTIDNIDDKFQIQRKIETTIVYQSSSSFMKVPATLLNLTTKEINVDVIEKMSIVLSSKQKWTPKVLCCKLFGKKFEAIELLQHELKNNKQMEPKGISSIFMTQLDANIKNEIVQAIKNKSLCEWHVSLAPTVSYNFWQKCCIAFAEQLIEQNYALQAATYMIAIHNQREAIRMLLEKNYFKEALLIARTQLQSDDPLITSITDKWILYLDYTGNFAGAALLCVLSGQLNRAYEALIKIRSTQPEIERLIKLLHEKSHFG